MNTKEIKMNVMRNTFDNSMMQKKAKIWNDHVLFRSRRYFRENRLGKYSIYPSIIKLLESEKNQHLRSNLQDTFSIQEWTEMNLSWEQMSDGYFIMPFVPFTSFGNLKEYTQFWVYRPLRVIMKTLEATTQFAKATITWPHSIGNLGLHGM
jgi:hypothetical protein